jgi:hypothetical protein
MPEATCHQPQFGSPGEGIMMRDQGDKEIRFACGLSVVGCGRFGEAKSELSVKNLSRQHDIRQEMFDPDGSVLLARFAFSRI